jgi:hypothetical protein
MAKIYALVHGKTNKVFVACVDDTLNNALDLQKGLAEEYNTPFLKDLKLYGMGAFNIILLENCDQNIELERLRHWIDHYTRLGLFYTYEE